MSFEKTYGPELKNIIEVHHIVPLNQIGEAYVVDPINDLIPSAPIATRRFIANTVARFS